MRLPKISKRTVMILSVLLVVCALIPACFAAEEAADTGFTFIGTWWSILPPLCAIALALITKEVYISLFLGIFIGAGLYCGFAPVAWMETIFSTDVGFLAALTDSWNQGILIFDVMLGIVGVLMMKSGGSMAYGRWTKANIKSRKGAQFMTFLLGIFIFVDDYFNCLTVGSVMRPCTDEHKVSRAKLSYLIDSTAAPVCIIAPISSWAAAVAGSMDQIPEGYNSLGLFCRSIPFNFYAILTLVFIVCLIFMNIDFGPMRKHEENAVKNNDLFTTGMFDGKDEDIDWNPKGKVIDLFIPIIALIVFNIAGLLYTGNWAGFGGDANVADALGNCDASIGLVYGSFLSILFMFIYYLCRRVLSVKDFAQSISEGFINMAPAMLILTFAWTLSTITLSLGLRDVVAVFVEESAAGLQYFLPFIVCLIAMGLSFCTGTSWGTFGMLLPIVLAVFPIGAGNDNLGFLGIAACLSGAVFGDHCSPISDTTIMSSAGARCDHMNHVSTQIPYALVCGTISAVFFLIGGFFPVWYVLMPVAIVITVLVCLFLKKKYGAIEEA